MSNDIVVVNVSVTQAPTLSTLQGTGAFVTQGGTTEAANSLTQVGSLADVTAILAPAKALTSLTWSASVVTGTTTAPHGWTNADVIQGVIAGAVPTGYNGTFAITITGASTFTYPLMSNPGSETTPGTVQLAAVNELTQMATTFFAQGSGLACNVLELGEADVAIGIAALATWISNNPETVYQFEVPREFAGDASYDAFLDNYASPSAMTYFDSTLTDSNYTNYSAVGKSLIGLIEAPGVAATEFTMSAMFYRTLNYKPSSSNKVPPTCFAFQYGVTNWKPSGNNTKLTAYKAANVNYVTTGAEGGLTNSILKWGVTKDGKDFSYWYSVDWVQINLKQALANEIIDGSNNFINPLYYSQAGIDRLQTRAGQTMGSAITNGLALGSLVLTRLPAGVFAANVDNGLYNGQVVVNAEPFTVYTAENPDDYAAEIYNGLSVAYTPQNGFRQIIVNLNVTDFPAAG